MEPPDESPSSEAPADTSGPDAPENPPAPGVSIDRPGEAGISDPVEESTKAAGETNAAEVDAEVSIVEPPPLPVEAPPKPATWQEKDAGEWFPEGFRAHLPMLEDYRYEDHFERETGGPTGWKILAATRRGRMHAHRGNHREDALRFCYGRDFIVLCVSDGAGSCQYSRVGSEVACRTVVTALEKELTGNSEEFAALDREALTVRIAGAIVEATKAAVGALEDTARNTESVAKDYRCTLLTTVLYLGAKGNFALASQVGDGFFAGLSREEQARRYGASDSGSYSGEVTCFVPDAEAANHAARIHSIDLGDLEALIVATDGIEDPFYPLEKNAAAIFRQLYQGDGNSLPGFESRESEGPIIGDPAACKRLAEWLAFEKKGENDDRTIAIIYRDPPSARG